MKTYRRLYGEHLKRQRNERAPPIWCERSPVKESDRCSWNPYSIGAQARRPEWFMAIPSAS